jgi:hypothetical protein
VKALALAIAAVLGIAAMAEAEVVQRGNLRVSFEGKMSPQSLPRTGTAPIAVALKGTIASTDGSTPPQLRRVTIAINRHGRIDATGLPLCSIEQIQPATTKNALQTCGPALVGEGRFSARILLPEQAPFPSTGRIFAFNGTYKGKPAVLAHIYGEQPAPTSVTLPFMISRAGGAFATRLTASLPQVTSEWGYVTGLEMKLQRRFVEGGKRRSFISAGCPAPEGFPGAVFPLARASYDFAGGATLGSTLVRNCRVSR